jgi:hypothetical protein
MRWWSPDPVYQPWQSPYTVMDNNPVLITDILGNEGDGGGSTNTNSSGKAKPKSIGKVTYKADGRKYPAYENPNGSIDIVTSMGVQTVSASQITKGVTNNHDIAKAAGETVAQTKQVLPPSTADATAKKSDVGQVAQETAQRARVINGSQNSNQNTNENKSNNLFKGAKFATDVLSASYTTKANLKYNKKFWTDSSGKKFAQNTLTKGNRGKFWGVQVYESNRNLAKKVAKGFKNAAKKWAIAGVIITTAEAFSDGEATKGDAVKIGSGLIQLIPGIGTAVTVVDVGAELFTGKSVTDRVAEYVDKKRK